MPATAQYVLLRHETPPGHRLGPHWDFMIEVGDALRTWAFTEAPDDGREITAYALPDHRKAYLEFEGAIEGGRGTVTRCDRGAYSLLRQSAGELLLELRGARLAGQALLTLRPSARQPAEADHAQRWMFKFTSSRVAIGSLERAAGLGE